MRLTPLTLALIPYRQHGINNTQYQYVLMKLTILSLIATLAFAVSASADSSAKITGVHLCCKKCVTGVQKAVDKVPNAKAEIDADNGTVTLSGPDAATVQKAADSMVEAGYFGKSSDVKMDPTSGAKGAKVSKLTVEGVHLCCAKCVKAADKALKSVPGVKENTAAKDAKSFDVTGDFNDKEVFTALQNEGLTGKVAK
jgi:copper chaperone CopZ